MVTGLINANPVVYERKERHLRSSPVVIDEYAVEPIDQLEIFDILYRTKLYTFTCVVFMHIYLTLSKY